MRIDDLYASQKNIDLKFINLDTGDTLTEDERWLIALGGFFSSLSGDYVNTMETGHDNKNIRLFLQRYWRISDRSVFEQTALRLTMGERRVLFLKRLKMLQRFFGFYDKSNIVVKFVAKCSPMLALDWYQTKTKEDLKAFARSNLELDRLSRGNGKKSEELFRVLKEATQWRKDIVELGDYSTISDLVAWDAVSLVSLARYATQIQLINREEFVKYAGAIKKQVQAAYNSWDEVGLAYVIGSLMYRCSETKSKVLVRAMTQYLENDHSLIQKIKFK